MRILILILTALFSVIILSIAYKRGKKYEFAISIIGILLGFIAIWYTIPQTIKVSVDAYINCKYECNYPCLFYDTTIDLNSKVSLLKANCYFKNISTYTLHSIDVEIYSTPILLSKNIKPFSTEENETYLMGYKKTYLLPGDSTPITNIISFYDPGFLQWLFLPVNSGIIELPTTYLIKSPIEFSQSLTKSDKPYENTMKNLYYKHFEKYGKLIYTEVLPDLPEFAGNFGFKYRIFLRFNVNEITFCLQFFGALYYPTKLGDTKMKILAQTYPTVLFDYLIMHPKGIAIQNDKINKFDAIDNIDFLPLDCHIPIKLVQFPIYSTKPRDYLICRFWDAGDKGKDTIVVKVDKFKKFQKD